MTSVGTLRTSGSPRCRSPSRRGEYQDGAQPFGDSPLPALEPHGKVEALRRGVSRTCLPTPHDYPSSAGFLLRLEDKLLALNVVERTRCPRGYSSRTTLSRHRPWSFRGRPPSFSAFLKLVHGGIDLPQVVGDLPLEADMAQVAVD
jgi:hypothetical protein